MAQYHTLLELSHCAVPDSSDRRRKMCGMSGDVGIQKSCTSPRISGRYLRTCWRKKDTSTVSCWNKNSLRVSSLPLITPNSTGITCRHDGQSQLGKPVTAPCHSTKLWHLITASCYSTWLQVRWWWQQKGIGTESSQNNMALSHFITTFC